MKEIILNNGRIVLVDNVIPNRKCEKCGKSTIDFGIKPELVATKYHQSEII